MEYQFWYLMVSFRDKIVNSAKYLWTSQLVGCVGWRNRPRFYSPSSALRDYYDYNCRILTRKCILWPLETSIRSGLKERGPKALLSILGLMLSTIAARSETAEDLLADAVVLYEIGLKVSSSSRWKVFTMVEDELEKIVAEYPGSDLAVQILLDQPVGGIDIVALRAFLAEAEQMRPFETAVTFVNPLVQLAEKGAVVLLSGEPAPRSALDRVWAETVEERLGLDRTARREIQRRLLFAGFDPNGVDGIFGPQTRRSIEAWQANNGYPPIGFLVAEQIQDLKEQTQSRYARWQRESEEATAARSRVINGVSWTYRSGRTYPYCRPCPEDYQCRMMKWDELCQIWPPPGW